MPKHNRRIASLMTITACAGALAACGGDAAPEREPATPAQRAAFIAKGDAVCAAYNGLAKRLRRQLIARRAEVLSEANLKPYAAPLGVARDGARLALGQFKAIAVPAGDDAAIKRLTDAMTEQQQLLDKLTNATLANDTATFKPLNDRLVSVSTDERRIAHAYGFKECGSRS